MSAGGRIVAHRRVPTADWLSFTLAGVPWVDFEWLTQVLWVLLFEATGWWGLLLLKAALFGAAGFALWKTLELLALPRAARGGWLLAWALAMLPANDLRPENFSIALFALEWWWLERERLLMRKFSWPEAAGVAAFFMLWANLHAGFAYGLVVLGLAALGAGPGRRSRLVAFALAAAAGTLANPAGWNLYPVLLEHAQGLSELSVLIREWQAPTLRDPWLWPFWGLLFMAFGAILKAQMERRLQFVHLAVVCLFGLSAAQHVRTVPYFVVVAVPVAAVALAGWTGPLRRHAALGATVALLGFWAVRVVPQLRAEPMIARYAPEGLARFLIAQAEVLGNRRMFHPVEWGGFLGWRLGPRFPVFADGRYLFHDLMRAMEEGRRTPEDFARLLERHRIDVVLLKQSQERIAMEAPTKEGFRVMLSRPAYLFFLPRPAWALVHWDKEGLLFVRRSRVPAAWLQANEYTLWRPGDLEAAHLQIKEGLATAALLASERARLGEGARGR